MKKILFLLVFAALVLSSCSPKGVVSCKETDSEWNDPNVFSIDGELPDIGEFSGGKKAGRFYEEYTPDFIPSDEYGEIIPFVGGYKKYHIPETDASELQYEQGYAAYGFCTPDGKIVMDSSEQTTYINYSETNDGFCYYSVTRENAASKEDYSSNETLIIPKSGEWCIRLPANSWVSGVEGGLISVIFYSDEGGIESSVFYDYNGNKKITLEKGEGSPGAFSCGRARVANWSEQYPITYIDSSGLTVLGPYEDGSDFTPGGVACVKDMQGESYLINTAGIRLTDGDYVSITHTHSQDGEKVCFSATHADNEKKHDIFDSDGKYVSTVDGAKYIYVRKSDSGNILYNYYASEVGEIWRRTDGSYLKSNEYDVAPNGYEYENDIFFYRDELNGSGVIFDENGDTIAYFDDFWDYNDISDDGRYMIYTSGAYKYDYDHATGEGTGIDTRKTHIYDLVEKKTVYTAEGPAYAAFVGDNDRYVKIMLENTENIMGGYMSYMIYDNAEGKFIYDDIEHIQNAEINGEQYISVCTKNSSALYDGEMNLILKMYNE